MSLPKILFATAAMALSFALTTPAVALVWHETAPGAGESLATAQNTIGTTADRSLSEIFGTLDTIRLVNQDPRTQVDVFRIFIGDVGSFSARTVSANNDDTSLFLFNGAGRGVYSNDDTITDLLSYLPPGGPLLPGFYFLGVSLGGYMARDALGASLFAAGSFTDVVSGDPSAGALASFAPTFVSLYEGGLGYDILLTGAQVAAVPEPETVLLVFAGLAAVAARARRQGRAVRAA